VVYQQILIENPKALEDRIVIEALNACSGSLQWRYPSPWESIFALDTGDQTVAGGRVFSPFTAGDGVQELVALSRSGHLIWSYPGANMGEGPIVVSGGVVYTTSYQAAFAFDAATGRLLWTIPGEFWGLAAADGTVYLNTATGTRAVTAAAGKLLWTRANPGADCGPCSIAVSGGRVFSLGLVTIQALNARTGTVIWQANRPTTGAMSAPAIGSHALLLTTVTGGLYAYNTGTGARLWSHPGLKAINNSSVPAVADGVVYAGTEDGQVIAFSAGTGAALWHARPSTQELSSATITDGHLYISTTFTGATYAYGLH
jgi:outer membrane protein assembly factor BamB